MKIKKLAVALVFATIVALIGSGILYWNYLHYDIIPYKPMPLIDFKKEYLTSNVINLTRNNDFKLNLTVDSISDKELVIPFSLELYSIFRDGVQDVNPEVSGFSYRFEPSSIIVAPSGSNSTLLTVKFSSDADTVEYDFRIRFGNSDEHHVGGTILRIEVYP